jgi:hypothetical protein
MKDPLLSDPTPQMTLPFCVQSCLSMIYSTIPLWPEAEFFLNRATNFLGESLFQIKVIPFISIQTKMKKNELR